MPVRHRSLRFGFLEGTALLALAAGGYLLGRGFEQADDTIAREEAALVVVRRIAAQEAAFRQAARLDRNADGQPEFGGLADLHGAGLLEAAPLVDAEGPHLVLPGYRVEILLPTESDPAGRRLFTRARDRVDPRLSAQAFAVVAMPAFGGPRTLRAFYLDAQGGLFVAEGVYDPDRDPSAPPPRIELRDEAEGSRRVEGAVWRRVEPARPGSSG